MKKEKNIVKKLNKQYFWDIDINSMNPEKSKKLIIERVFTMGTSEDIRLIRLYYGDNIIKEVLTNLNYLDPKTHNFASKLFNIPIQSFKCFTRMQSKPELWNS